MNLFNSEKHKEEGNIKEAIENHYEVQDQIEKDLTNGKKEKAIMHIKKSMKYLNAIGEGCATNGYRKLLPKIDELRGRYKKMIEEHNLEL